MRLRICKCCGERMPESRSELCANPNVCASCSDSPIGGDESGATAGIRFDLNTTGDGETTDGGNLEKRYMAYS